MDTFLDMRNLALKLYKKIVDAGTIPIVSEEIDEDMDIVESTNDFQDDNETDFDPSLKENMAIISAVCENAFLLPDEELNRFISLLVLFFSIRTIYFSDEDYFKDEKSSVYDDELFQFILNEDKDFVIQTIKDPDSGYLFDLIALILEEDIMLYDSFVLDTGYLGDYDYYEMMEAAIEKDYTAQLLLSKYHPNLNREEQDFKIYRKNEKLLDKYSKVVVNSLSQFIELFVIAKENFQNIYYLQCFLLIFLENMRCNNYLLYQDITIFILKYYYICKYSDVDNYSLLQRDVSGTVQSMKYDDFDVIDSRFVNCFLNFNFAQYVKYLKSVPRDVLNDLNSIVSLDNCQTYGNKGIWKEYDEKDESLILKYAPSWLPFYDDKKLIFYSEDKNGNFTIPRICIALSEDNYVKNIFGRDKNATVELELIDTLDNKLKEFSNYDELYMDVCILKCLSSIQDKIKMGEDLTKDEIDLLFEINVNVDKTILYRLDYRINTLRTKFDMKKCLATYYGCKEEEVALTKNELNENTVVAKSLFLKEKNCYFPKLRIVLGDVHCNYLEDAKGLCSLEFIKGSAYFYHLKKSDGLSNLIRIDKDCHFPELEDSDWLNPDLEVAGKLDLRNELISKIKKNFK